MVLLQKVLCPAQLSFQQECPHQKKDEGQPQEQHYYERQCQYGVALRVNVGPTIMYYYKNRAHQDGAQNGQYGEEDASHDSLRRAQVPIHPNAVLKLFYKPHFVPMDKFIVVGSFSRAILRIVEFVKQAVGDGGCPSLVAMLHGLLLKGHTPATEAFSRGCVGEFYTPLPTRSVFPEISTNDAEGSFADCITRFNWYHDCCIECSKHLVAGVKANTLYTGSLFHDRFL
jgi:hypothetical protein